MPDPSLEKPKFSLRDMGFRKAVIHIWTYYKWYFIIPIIVIGVLLSMLNSYLKATRKEYLNIVLVNARYESDTIFDDYAKSLGVRISVDSTFHYPTNEDGLTMSQDVASEVQKLAALVRSGVTNVLITNARSIKEFGQSGVRDLRQVLTESQFADLEARGMIYYLELEDGSSYPAGINITDVEFFKAAYEGSEEKHYLIISNWDEKIEEERKLLEYLFFS